MQSLGPLHLYTVKNEEFGLLFGGVIMGSNTYGEFK